MDEKSADIRETFGFFERSGVMSLNDLATAMRALNFNPSEKQLEDYKKQLAEDGKGLDLAKFKQFVLQLTEEGEQDTKDMLVNAFKVFDKNGLGYIQTSELKYVMTSLGERYSNEEFEELVRAVDKDGFIKYDEFAHRLLMTYQQLGDELLNQ
eukprot:NODE_1552_length_912_cov_79.790267_g1206_i0.p1 GENE.NODE_1552_length_912_cov_79.790267_g1206_i0~~NODE_1552_length_912_cov_79.790267_g1206_i0.p1  ORF type:complete len:153 (+),score=34.67 NODE_1552_length_912_cov_79.790267_g1206_i0:90-548(+)